ncbi:hypothetical protein MTO96_051577 [Rhipicephalus appendiculatus]
MDELWVSLSRQTLRSERACACAATAGRRGLLGLSMGDGDRGRERHFLWRRSRRCYRAQPHGFDMRRCSRCVCAVLASNYASPFGFSWFSYRCSSGLDL